MDSTKVNAASRRASEHPALDMAARAGYAVNGVLHILIGLIAVRLAWTSTTTDADQSGALSTLADTPVGLATLWIGVVGWLGLALWQVTQALSGTFETSERVKAAAKAVVYALLSWTAFRFATGGGSSSSDQSTDATKALMEQPFGQWLVGAVGVGVVAVGGYHVVKGYKRGFLQDLESHPGGWIVTAGRAGYISKGIALGIVGALFVVAALRHKPSEAKGLDGALRTLLEAPAGQLLLTLVAVGLMAFGVYSFGRARHADL